MHLKSLTWKVAISAITVSWLTNAELGIAQNPQLEVINQTGESLVELYFSPSEQNDFGANILNRPLQTNTPYQLPIPLQECYYDILGVFSNGDYAVNYNIDVCNLYGGQYTFLNSETEPENLIIFNGSSSPITSLIISGEFSNQPANSIETSPLDICDERLEEELFREFPLENLDRSPLEEFCDVFNLGKSPSLPGGNTHGTSSSSSSICINNECTVTEQQTECQGDTCSGTFLKTVNLLGDYSIGTLEEALVRAQIGTLACSNIQEYDVTASFRNGQTSTRPNVDLCRQGKVVFGNLNREYISINLRNATNESSEYKNLVLWEFYASPSSLDSNWGYDLLDSEPLSPGETKPVDLIDTSSNCLFDLRAVFVNPSTEWPK